MNAVIQFLMSPACTGFVPHGFVIRNKFVHAVLYGMFFVLKLQYRASLGVYITDQTTTFFAFIDILRTQHFILRYLMKPFIVILARKTYHTKQNVQTVFLKMNP
jgi:hypothetical protein